MEVIPAINCIDFECVKDKLRKASAFLSPESWLHIDVADARFTFNRTWGNAAELKGFLSASNFNFKLEIHLMVEGPQKLVADWLDAGARRIIVHREAIHSSEDFNSILEACRSRGVEAMLALSPETKVEDAQEFLDKVSWVQILAVNPGLAGQGFQHRVLDKISELKAKFPNIKIEVDGGINEENARLVKEKGVDAVVSASYIFSNSDPALAYSRLVAME